MGFAVFTAVFTAGPPAAHPAAPLPPAHVHADQFLARFGGLIGLALLLLGALYVAYGAYGVRAYPRLRPLSRSLTHVAANVAACGVALYVVFGAVRSGARPLVDLGFLFGHVIVIGLMIALVSGLAVAFVPVPDEEEAHGRRYFRLRRFAWGVFAGFVAAPLVGMLAEFVIAASPALRLAAPPRGLLLLGEVFGLIAGWLVVAPVTGLVNVARAGLEWRAARLPRAALPGVGVALALAGAVVSGAFVPFSPQTAHAIARTIVLPLALR